ncbi:MAG: anaerobic glycerol-3-phosphate dehydrogenase subunit B [Proteobacteria bacterium]|nr:anaerobic glycerol-3-phosphate dehydrogenase subunit B [Pseudomonadota bacterium]NIS72343.1 anaerobic glycerol-3-phosphate dehydrogenase subunit B [Pseudomonadota bacterium]
MKYDVIVIGAGLSGLMAAKEAADNGMKTMILGKGMGLMHVLSGGIDLLGYYPGEDMTTQNGIHPALIKLIQNEPDHPYARVGMEDIKGALRSFSEVFGPEAYHYTGTPGRNTTLPTGVGTLRPSYLVPSTMIGGKDILSRPTLLIGFHGFGSFYSVYAAKNLMRLGNRRGDIRLRSEDIEVSDIAGRSIFKAASLASQLDEESFRERVAARIRMALNGEDLVGFPAVLGLREAANVKMDLEARIGAQVFELSVLPPSIPGMRLFEIFKRRLQAGGVRMILGFEVISAMRKNRYCHCVVLKTPSGERRYEADSFVLATGGLFGGGLRAERDRIVEPIFQLPVAQPKSRKAWFHDELFGPRSHPINRAGIRTDTRLNPIDENRRVILQNLFVAGSILGHHDPTREKSGTGVMIATGFKAVRNLLEK